MYSLDDMRVFAAVVEGKGFTAASKTLGLSVSLISKRMTALEADLTTRLLNRTTRKISLTEAGTIFYQYCLKVIAEAQEAEDAVMFLNEAPRGLLKISAPESFGGRQLSVALPSFMEKYPDIQIDLDIGNRPVDLVEEAYDVAIRFTDSPPPFCVARRLTSTKRLVCAAPSYWQKFGYPKTPNDLQQHSCIIYQVGSNPHQWVFSRGVEVETITVQGRLQVNNANAMLEAAIGGLGAIWITSYTVDRAIADGQLEPVLLDYSSPGADIYALYLPNRYLSSKARAFIDYMIEWFKDK